MSRPGDDHPSGPSVPIPEHRAPVLGTLALTLAVPLLFPSDFTLGPRWLLPTIGAVLLVVIALADPGHIDTRSRHVRALRIALAVVLVCSATFATSRLIDDLVRGGGITNSAGQLLRAGALVWVFLVLVFGFLFWELDGGGPGRRSHRTPPHPDLAFPQHVAPEVARPGWRPMFFDYLYLGFTNATAFSPTDVMPLVHWAKLVMALESLASLVIIGLVVARAVNILN